VFGAPWGEGKGRLKILSSCLSAGDEAQVGVTLGHRDDALAQRLIVRRQIRAEQIEAIAVDDNLDARTPAMPAQQAVRDIQRARQVFRRVGVEMQNDLAGIDAACRDHRAMLSGQAGNGRDALLQSKNITQQPASSHAHREQDRGGHG